jgi:hypothetical protein
MGGGRRVSVRAPMDRRTRKRGGGANASLHHRTHPLMSGGVPMFATYARVARMPEPRIEKYSIRYALVERRTVRSGIRRRLGCGLVCVAEDPLLPPLRLGVVLDVPVAEATHIHMQVHAAGAPSREIMGQRDAAVSKFPSTYESGIIQRHTGVGHSHSLPYVICQGKTVKRVR